MNAIQTIAKNIGISGLYQILASIFGFLILIYTARYLGVTEFGVYSFAMSFTTLFMVLADIGVSQLIIREIARNKKDLDNYLSNAALIKILLSIITFFMIFIVINLMNYSPSTKLIVYLFGIYNILTSFALLFTSVFKAFEKMEYVAIVMVLEKVIIFTLGLFYLISGFGLVELAYIYVFAGIVEVILSILITFTKIKRTKINVNFRICRKLCFSSIPFGLNSVFGILYFKIDTVLLSVFTDNASVGIYNAAYNPLLALSEVLTGIVGNVFYPLMSKYSVNSKESLEKLSIVSTKYMAIIGFPIAVGCFLLASDFINLFYGTQYSTSIMAFQILSLFLPIRLISSITGTLLTSINKQNIRTFSVFISCIINIILNLMFIPFLGFLGASLSTVLSEIFLYIIFIYFVNRYTTKMEIHKNFLKPIIASITMGISLLLLPSNNIFLLIIIATIVYSAILIALKTFTNEDKLLLRMIIKGI